MFPTLKSYTEIMVKTNFTFVTMTPFFDAGSKLLYKIRRAKYFPNDELARASYHFES